MGNDDMRGFVPVCKVADLLPGQMIWVAVHRQRVLLANIGGAFYALKDECGHQRAPLSRGRLDGYTVECPLHFACFDVRTGRLLNGPVATDIPIYDVRVDGETVFVRPGDAR